MSLNTATQAVTEVQHGDNLEAAREHGQTWVSCKRCGRQWAIHGATAEQVSDGDGFCDDLPSESSEDES